MSGQVWSRPGCCGLTTLSLRWDHMKVLSPHLNLYIETEMSLFWRTFHTSLHWKSSKWQLQCDQGWKLCQNNNFIAARDEKKNRQNDILVQCTYRNWFYRTDNQHWNTLICSSLCTCTMIWRNRGVNCEIKRAAADVTTENWSSWFILLLVVFQNRLIFYKWIMLLISLPTLSWLHRRDNQLRIPANRIVSVNSARNLLMTTCLQLVWRTCDGW